MGVDASKRHLHNTNRHEEDIDKDNFEEVEKIIPTPILTPISTPISAPIKPWRSMQQKFPSQKTFNNSHP